MKNKTREYRIRHEHAQEASLVVHACSFVGAMRKAFGPGLYREIWINSEDERKIKWESPTLRQVYFFIVTAEPKKALETPA